MDLTFWKRLNAGIEKIIVFVTIGCIVFGLLLGARVLWMKPAVNWLFAFFTLSGSIGMSFRDIGAVVKHPLPVVAAFLVAHVIAPVCAWLCSSLFYPGNTDFLSGFMLLTAVPVAVSSYIWVMIYGGDEPACLTLIVIDTLLSPFVCPLTIRLFTASTVVFDFRGITKSMIMMVVVPSLIGLTINAFGRKEAIEKAQTVMKPFSKIALWLVILINIGSIASRTSFTPSHLPALAINVVLTVGSFLLGHGIAKMLKWNRPTDVTVTIGSSMRNINAALVLAAEFFPPEAAVPVVFGILLQQTLTAVTGKILFKGDGAPSPSAEASDSPA